LKLKYAREGSSSLGFFEHIIYKGFSHLGLLVWQIGANILEETTTTTTTTTIFKVGENAEWKRVGSPISDLLICWCKPTCCVFDVQKVLCIPH
jgi:hypothetical protein